VAEKSLLSEIFSLLLRLGNYVKNGCRPAVSNINKGEMDAQVLNGWSTRLGLAFSVTYNAAIDLDGAVVPKCAGRWTDLIERCLKFNAAERFASTDELVDELSALCDENSLQGDLTMDIDFGRLDLGPDTDGVIKPYWAVDPFRVFLDRSR
jgi:hypothetical protein